MDNFDAKFGPPPSIVYLVPPMPPHVVLIGQFVICAAVLILIQPPFVLSSHFDDGTRHDKNGNLCMLRVLTVAAITVSATYVLQICGVMPGDTFRGACDLVYKALRP